MPVHTYCDASKDGLGTIIMQGDTVIAYASRPLTDTICTICTNQKRDVGDCMQHTDVLLFYFWKAVIISKIPTVFTNEVADNNVEM